MMKRLALAWIVVLWGWPMGVFSEPLKHLTLDEIVVTGEAATDPVATTVDVKNIEKGKNINLPDVLKNEPDIDLKRRATVGDTADVMSIRGFSGNRIMLNINDRPINAAGVVGGYYIDWGTIPLDNIEKIEIIRGGSSVRYGNNALGGAINVITKKPTETPTITLFGSYGGGEDIDAIQNYRLTHAYKVGPLGYSLAASYQDSDAFLLNNDFEGRNFAATTYFDMPMEAQMTLSFQYAGSTRGFIRENRLSTDPDNPNFNVKMDDDYPLSFGETFSPYSGKAFIPGPGAEWDKTKYYLDFGYKQPMGDALLEVKAYQNHEDREEKNYSSSSVNSAYADGQLVLDRDVASDRSYGGSVEMTLPISVHELLAGVEHKVLAYGDTDLNYIDSVYNAWYAPVTGYKSSSKGVCWGYYLQDTWKALEHLTLTGGLRFDNYENQSIHGSTLPEIEDQALTPKLTGTYAFSEKDTLTGSIYQAMRTPGLPETYWWAEGATGGENDLKPEKNNAIELIYRHRFTPKDTIRLSAYHYRVEDYIMFRFDPNWRGVYNIDRATLTGSSIDGRTELTSRLSANASLTWQTTEKEGDLYDTAGLSDEIDYLPEWKGSAGVEFKIPFQAVLGMTVRYVGERRTIYSYSSGWPAVTHFKRVELDPYATVDVEFKIPVTRHGQFTLYAENLLDKEYEEYYGYPMPGVVVGATFKVMF